MTDHEIETMEAPHPVEPVDAKDPIVYVSTAKPKPPLTEQQIEDMKKPTVLIVGAGIGGLTLAILLHKAKIPFFVYERAHEVKPLGTLCVTEYLGESCRYDQYLAFDIF